MAYLRPILGFLTFFVTLVLSPALLAQATFDAHPIHLSHLEKIVTLSREPQYQMIWKDLSSLMEAVREVRNIGFSKKSPKDSQMRAEQILTDIIAKDSHEAVINFIKSKPTDNFAEKMAMRLAWVENYINSALIHGYVYVGHPDARLRKIYTEWFDEHFTGTSLESAIFPEKTETFTNLYSSEELQSEISHWMESASGHLAFFGASPVGKILAYIAFNAERDPDPANKKLSAKTWTRIKNALEEARADRPEESKSRKELSFEDRNIRDLGFIRHKLADRWLTEVQDINEEWAKQYRDLAKSWMATNNGHSQAIPKELAQYLFELDQLSIASRSLLGAPPIPGCVQALVGEIGKKTLN